MDLDAQTQTSSASKSSLRPAEDSGSQHQQEQDKEHPHPILRLGKKTASQSHVKFDEAAIREHDKLRGTRQKIDEPKTPFPREGDTGGVQLDLKALNAQLAVEKEEGVLPSAAQRAKKLAFEEKRRKHYNEMELVRKFNGLAGASDEDE